MHKIDAIKADGEGTLIMWILTMDPFQRAIHYPLSRVGAFLPR